MDIKSLKYFLAVVQEGTITGAARKLCIAQPPLSRQIRLLEEELGVTLFIRGKRRIQLTEEGRFLKQQAEEILALLEKTQEQLGRFGEEIHGLLSIAAVESFGISLLPRIIRSFHEHYPQVHFQIWCGNSDEVLDKLEKGLADVGIVRTPVRLEQYEQKFLRSEPWVAAMSRDHPIAREPGSEVALTRLGGEKLMIPVRNSMQEEILRWFQETQLQREILCYYNSSASMLPLVKMGMGVAVCPGSARYYPGGEEVVYKTIAGLEKESSLYLVRRRHQVLPSAAGIFWEFVTGETK